MEDPPSLPPTAGQALVAYAPWLMVDLIFKLQLAWRRRRDSPNISDSGFEDDHSEEEYEDSTTVASFQMTRIKAFKIQINYSSNYESY
eukprot:scaffold68204_cov23-Cyclotella_meneghiniana.AAC.2